MTICSIQDDKHDDNLFKFNLNKFICFSLYLAPGTSISALKTAEGK